MVGCALGSSRLWFTLGFGIVNEVYYPRVDIPQIRDLGLIVADGEGFWAEVKRVADYQLRLLAPGVPAVEIVHRHQRYSLLLRIAPGSRPRRPYRMGWRRVASRRKGRWRRFRGRRLGVHPTMISNWKQELVKNSAVRRDPQSDALAAKFCTGGLTCGIEDRRKRNGAVGAGGRCGFH
jgi:hypothetical protein